MKINFCNRTAIPALLAVAVALVAFWPATGHGQGSSRRDRFDRYRRETTSRPSSSKTEQTSRQVSEKKDQAKKATEPNTAGAAPANAAKARPAEAAPPMESPRMERLGVDAKYDVILGRNIFSRQRRSARREAEMREASKVVPPNPESYFTLKGVVQENDAFIAFVEDSQSGSVLKLRQGERVARGTIKTLSLDAIEYQLENQTISVKLGYNLEGGRGAVSTGQMQEWPTMTSTTGAAPATQTGQGQPPSADEAEILKRLMEQRQQQLGQ
jgi:hypothetical protein